MVNPLYRWEPGMWASCPHHMAGEAGLDPSSAGHRSQALNWSAGCTSQLHLLCSCQGTLSPCQPKSCNWAERSPPLTFPHPGGSKPAQGQPISGQTGGEGRGSVVSSGAGDKLHKG